MAFAVGLCCWIFCHVLLPSLVTHVLGSQWREALPVASILLLNNTVMLPSFIIPTHLTGKGHSLAWMQIVMVETILIWVIGGLGAVTFGLLGYAAGMLGASICVLAIECSLAKKLTGLQIRLSDSILVTIIASVAILASQSSGLLVATAEGLEEALRVIVGVSIFLGLLVLIDFKRIKQDVMILTVKLMI